MQVQASNKWLIALLPIAVSSIRSAAKLLVEQENALLPSCWLSKSYDDGPRRQTNQSEHVADTLMSH